MSQKIKKLLPQAAVLAVLGALVISLAAASGEPAYEVTVRAREMAFYVDGDPGPNPPLVLPAGRSVKLTFVNEDRGVEHDLALPGLGLRTKVLPGDGARQKLRFTTPVEAATSSYSCSLHLTMMTGRVEVR